MAEKWQGCFGSRVLGRGADYAAAGMVASLEKSRSGWRAIVMGSEDYTVTVPKSKDPWSATCTCPHYVDGNLCKHIAAVLFAIEQGQPAGADSGCGRVAAGERQSVEDIVADMTEADVRAFLVQIALSDDALERMLRSRFGKVDAKQAKRDLQQVTTSLTKRHERGGFIDWKHAFDFEHEYLGAVGDIMEPFFRMRDVDALVDLATVRLVQLQRVCIDDSDGFFTSAMDGIEEHLDQAFAWGDQAQRRKLFDAMRKFLEKNPGRDRGDVYWFEEESVREFLANRFATDPSFAGDMIALADSRIAVLPPDFHGRSNYDYNERERRVWRIARLNAMPAAGFSYDEISSFANEDGLLDTQEGLYVLVDACLAEQRLEDAAELLHDHLNARAYARSLRCGEVAKPAMRLVEVVRSMNDTRKLAETYVILLLEKPHGVRDQDLVGWYDDLRSILDAKAWSRLREELMKDLPASVAHLCLAHEGATEELYTHIMADEGRDLLCYEKHLVQAYPQPYVDVYAHRALDYMDGAHDRRGYQRVAEALSHLAGIEGGRERALQIASDLREAYSRRPALLDELNRAGV